MNAGLPSVVPIFATPFGVVPVSDAEVLNPAVELAFAARVAGAGVQGRGDPLCWISNDDLLEWPDEPVQRLATGILRGMYMVINAVNEFRPGELASLALQARAWFTIVRPDGHVPAGNHPLSAWCGIYCVAAPPASADRQDSGMLRFHETRFATAFADATTAVMRVPYRPGHYGWRPVPGQVAVFPAPLTHEIALLRAATPLVLVTVRARFVGPHQEGVHRW
jgi:hypothetical protein